MSHVETGPGLSPEEEAERRRAQAAVLAKEADEAIAVIEQKITGMQETLKSRKQEAKQWHAEANDGGDR